MIVVKATKVVRAIKDSEVGVMPEQSLVAVMAT